MADFTVEQRDPRDLTPNPLNWRRHPAVQRDVLRYSLSKWGFVQGVILNRTTGNLIDGHARVEEAIEQGRETIPVNVVDLSEEDERELLRLFDPIGALAETDTEALDRLIAEIGNPDLEAMLQGIGSGGGGLLVDADPDATPSVDEVEHRTSPGDLWRLGDHRLLCGDSTVVTDVERLMDRPAEACLTDPPYGLASPSRVQKRGDRMETFEIEWDDEAPLEWIEPAAAAMTPGAAVIAFWDNAFVSRLWCALADAGIKPLRTLYWVKPTCPQPRPNFCNNVESAVFGRKEGPVLCWNGGGATPNVFDASRAAGHERTEHETQKPMALWQPLVEVVTDPGFVVYDPFAGSGTTLIACEQTGRVCRAMEISERYCDVILSRFEVCTGREAVLIDRASG